MSLYQISNQLGHSDINTNRISIDVNAEVDGDTKPISFSAVYLKEILVANKDATNAVLNISTQGLAHIQFDVDIYKSDYYFGAKSAPIVAQYVTTHGLGYPPVIQAAENAPAAPCSQNASKRSVGPPACAITVSMPRRFGHFSLRIVNW